MEQKSKITRSSGHYGRYVMASLFVITGILLLARNMGWISTGLFATIVSWQSLLIVLGLYSLVRRNYIGGAVMVLIGGYFMLSGSAWLPDNSKVLLWPLVLIVVGLYFFLGHRRHNRGGCGRGPMRRQREEWMGKPFPGMNRRAEQQSCESEDGFLRSENSFGSVRHVVLDEVFKGADVHISCGGTIIDLRHTHLAPGETYIDLDCNLGGLEIYVPSDWVVVFKCNAFFGGCEDKRWQNGNLNQECVLVVRGKLSFGGLEVKD